MTSPDVLFQPLNPALGPAPAQPPANIAILPLGTFARSYAPALRTITPANVGSNVQPGAQTGSSGRSRRSSIRGRSRAAIRRPRYNLADRTRNRVERSLPGQIQFVDNLSDSLNTAAGDALYANALYIMLAVPGALIALGLAYLAALGTVERDRRDLALLRARGATRRDLLVMAGVESAVIGLLAGLAGAGLAFLAVSAVVKGGVGLTLTRAAITAAACVVLAFAGAAAARIGASVSVLRASVADSRRSGRREGKPLWQRLYLDLVRPGDQRADLLADGAHGFLGRGQPRLQPDPLALHLHVLRAGAAVDRRDSAARQAAGPRLCLAGAARGRGSGRDGSGFSACQRRPQGAAINRGLVVVGLLLAFGVNLGIFSATYDQQAAVDAQLTLGADVTVTAPPGVTANKHLPQPIARVPGVQATTALDHSYAYIGPDLQDTYGINPATFTNATTLRDSYFIGDSASSAISKLKTTPDGILVGKETITDYSLAPGDLLKLRVLDRSTGAFRVVPFHVVGVVQEFPSAPKDSFMVTNLSYLQKVSQGAGPNVVFAKTSGDPSAVSRRIAAATRSDGTIVKNIRQQTQQTVSSITTVDLSGISRIEQAFAILLAAGAMGLFVALGLAERKHEFATMAALGAPLRQVGRFLWSEVVLVLGVGLVLAAGLGFLLSEMLVAMLQHVFDPPPDTLAIPWGFLGGLAGAAMLGGLVATALAMRALRRLPLGSVLREQ